MRQRRHSSEKGAGASVLSLQGAAGDEAISIFRRRLLRCARHGKTAIFSQGRTVAFVVRSVRKDDLQTEYAPLGHSTNIATHMESLATPASIVVSEHTYRLTQGYFDFKPS
jgi:class 3 adenylate cyclase